MGSQRIVAQLVFIVIIVVAHLATTHCQTSATVRLMNRAITLMLSDKTSSIGFDKIEEHWFGATSDLFPDVVCNELEWPDVRELRQYETWNRIVERNAILYGTNSVTNIPKRFNYTSVSSSPEYGKVVGFEADIAASITTRINNQYGLELQTYFSVSDWYTNVEKNIVAALYRDQFDFILSGMSFNNTWANPKYVNSTATPDEPQRVARNTLLDFSCTYHDGGYGVNIGPLPLPEGVSILSSKDIDQEGVVVCVQASTTMASIAHSTLNYATIYEDKFAKELTIANTTCHAYISPIINALWDGENIDNSKYIGKIGPQSVVTAEAVSVGVRFESAASPSETGAASSLVASIYLQFVVALFVLLTLV